MSDHMADWFLSKVWAGPSLPSPPQGPVQYVLRPRLSRLVVPRLFLSVILGLFLLGGVWLNLALLDISITFSVLAAVIVGIILLMLLDLFLFVRRDGSVRYEFYLDRLDIVGKNRQEVPFGSVDGVSFRKGFLDRMFRTITIVVEPDTHIVAVADSNQVFVYIQQLIGYYQSNLMRG